MKKILIILFVLIIKLGFSQKPTDIVIKGKVNADLLEKLMLEEINIYRKSKGLHALLPDSALFKQSRKHSEWMEKNTFKHSNNGNYLSECCFNGAYSFGQSYIFNAKGLIRVWIESPDHNDLLLDRLVNTGGVGIKILDNSYDGIYTTLQMSIEPTKEDLERITSF